MVELRERKTEIGIGLFLLVGIGAWLMIPSVFPADTIILVNPDTGGGPVSCLPSGALILAQNLTDLCDVTIVNATTGQIIEYNGTQWVNVNAANFTDTTVCINQTTGHGLCINDLIELKNLATCDACYIGITSNATHVSIFNLGVTDLIEGGGITVDQPSNSVTISSFCDNIGTGIAVCDSDNNINSLIAGTGMTVTDTVDDITLASQCANTGTGEPVCESSNNINSLIAGNGIQITDTTGDLTITANAQKICDAVSAGGETTLTCTFSSSNFKSIIIQSSWSSSGADTWALRVNGDSGTNYATRSSTNGAADATQTSQTFLASVTITANQWYHYNYLCNEPLAGQEKHCYGNRQTSVNGAGNADSRVELASKWANTASLITDVELVRTAGAGTMTAGSFITVWGTTS